jgi:hypothetical protein
LVVVNLEGLVPVNVILMILKGLQSALIEAVGKWATSGGHHEGFFVSLSHSLSFTSLGYP